MYVHMEKPDDSGLPGREAVTLSYCRHTERQNVLSLKSIAIESLNLVWMEFVTQ